VPRLRSVVLLHHFDFSRTVLPWSQLTSIKAERTTPTVVADILLEAPVLRNLECTLRNTPYVVRAVLPLVQIQSLILHDFTNSLGYNSQQISQYPIASSAWKWFPLSPPSCPDHTVPSTPSTSPTPIVTRRIIVPLSPPSKSSKYSRIPDNSDDDKDERYTALVDYCSLRNLGREHFFFKKGCFHHNGDCASSFHLFSRKPR
jgi:hypothetical protein